MPRKGPHNWSPEGRRRQLRAARRAGLKTWRKQVGIMAPGYNTRPDVLARSRQFGLENIERQRKEKIGLFAPGLHERPEVQAAQQRNGRRNGKAALLRGDGIHSPDMDHSNAGRLGAESLESLPQPDLFRHYGRHVHHHINDTRKHKDVFCIFCDKPKTLPRWFFEGLRAEFQGGSLVSGKGSTRLAA
jgi:hypothetical protein